MTREEAKSILGDVRAYLASRASLENESLAGHSFIEICNAIKSIEQDSVLNKIRAEIESEYGQCDICEYFEDYDYEENDISEYRPIGDIADILQIIDKYRK